MSAYVPGIAWGWCYVVAIAIDCVLFYLCAQLFSDLFVGMEGERRYLDLPTALLFSCFLSLSLFMSIKGADVRKTHHAVAMSEDKTTKDAISTMVASIDTTKHVITKDMERNQRKSIQANAKKQQANSEALGAIVSALDIHNQEQVQAKKDIGELLDFSKTVVVLFQLLLIVCCACSEYIKSKKDSNSKSSESAVKAGESKGESKSKTPESNVKSEIGFSQTKEGDIRWNGTSPEVAFKKADGTFAWYKRSNLSSMIGGYEKRGKVEKVERLERLKSKLPQNK
jgi:hypothetical protein